jgi:hypothetical protein
MSTYRSNDNPPSGSPLSAGQPQSTSPTPGASAASVGAEGGAQQSAEEVHSRSVQSARAAVSDVPVLESPAAGRSALEVSYPQPAIHTYGPRSSAGEHLPCKQGVPGSSPGRSTTPKTYAPIYYITVVGDDRLHLKTGRALASLRETEDDHFSWTPDDAWSSWIENALVQQRSLIARLHSLGQHINQARNEISVPE